MSVFSNRDFADHEQVVFCSDDRSGLKAIIAVHNSNLGPVLGGCRMWPYASEDEAVRDVLRLSRGMTYKSAIANLKLGGGKSVIIGNPRTDKTPELLKAFGARVTGVRRTVSGELPACIDRMITFDRLEQELPRADHVVLLLPGERETDGIFTGRHFAAMKPGSFLYNLGRGNCYREEDLLAALNHGPLAGAGLDVFADEPLPSSSPLWEQHNVLVTPHASAVSREYIELFICEWLERLRGL